MKNYNIGLDIGTTSVGWAVVETDNQKVMRKGNKALWGVRLFDEANPAAQRRNFRSARRRYDRRRYRISLLQEEFKEEINKIDSDFFQILKESFYQEDDVINKTIVLTKEEKELFKVYQQNYKTIYHLRDALINEDRKFDIRLVYLAIHHIIKYRGNFLYQGDKFNVDNLDVKEKIKMLFDSIINLSNEIELSDNYIDLIDFNNLEQAILLQSKNDRKIEIKNNLSTFPKPFIDEFIKMVNGNKFNFLKMLMIEDADYKIELSFGSSDYDDKYDEFENNLKDKIEILSCMKEIYDTVFLKMLFKGSKNASISNRMIDNYNTHKKDLKFLKQLFNHDRKLYNQIFRSPKNAKEKEYCLYDKYIRNKITYEELIKELNKYLERIFDYNIEEELITKYETEIKERMDNGFFLPRITSTDNGKFPYQLNKSELIKIIENQGKYYPFLLKKYDDKTYRIVRLLEFRIPYYVGPLTSSNKSEFAWMVRNNDEKITPFNFDEVVNKEETAEKFIKRMISKCTYLLKEDAMPTNSILYSKFKVLNELKQIKLNDNSLALNLQHKIYKELFLKSDSTITDKEFKRYIYANKEFNMYGTDINVTGYSADNKFANSMKSYVDFIGDDGILTGTPYNQCDAEKIIEWITIFEDKDILKTKLEREYPLLTKEKIDAILKKKYIGWSSLSEKLLTKKYYYDEENASKKSIMDLMYETEKNFMQIINDDKYKFQQMIAEENDIDETKKLNYEVVENLATSPANKRGIYQALKIVEELVEYIGYEPKNIVIEMARSTEEKKRKDTRKEYLKKLYESCKDSISDYKKLKEELDTHEITSRRLFLYFIQEGKCLYSGEDLTLEDIENKSLYEVDHIIPRTLIKDDSIDNKALVFRKYNQDKQANYVVPESYQIKQIKWWKHLVDVNLMSRKKFHSLTRKVYKKEEIEGFINRQLVETRQITKHVANILKNYYKDSKVIYLKASLSHNYREKYNLYKFRDINNYHHTHDAYLAAVLGEYKENYLRRKVDFNSLRELNNELRETKNYKDLKYGYVINSLDYTANTIVNRIIPNTIDEETGEVLTKDFDADLFNKRVEDTLYRNDILVSKKTEIKTGEFYNQTKSRKGGNGVRLKENLPTEKYGSYTSLNPSYALMITYKIKDKEKKKMIGMPIYIETISKKDKNIKLDYIVDLLKLDSKDDIKSISKPIPFYSLLNWNGQICYLVGASNYVEVVNGKEFKFNKDDMIKYKHSLNRLFNDRKQEIDVVKYNDDLVNIIEYIIEEIDGKYSLYKSLIPELKEMIGYNDLTNLSEEEKENTIIELMKLLKCNSQNANFKFLSPNFSSAFGKKNGRTIENCIIYNKSKTGIRCIKNEL